MNLKIIKLLSSGNKEDMLIGWELLKKHKPKNQEEWVQYLACLRYKTRFSKEVDDLQCKFITEVCGKKFTNSSIYRALVLHWNKTFRYGT